MPEATAPDATLTLPPLGAGGLEDVEAAREACEAFRTIFNALRSEIGRVLIGQDEVVEQTLIALFSHGHVLLEGVPGLGKTLLVRTLAQSLHLPFSRIQFTPDLMPADIAGTTIVVEDGESGHRSFKFRPGPIFSQLVLADEINRATPKSQSALLEAMQERSVTVGSETHRLSEPFFVMATQNPIEQEGTYPLPEAQLDRFMFKVQVPFTTRKELNEIMRTTTVTKAAEARRILDADRILDAQRLAQRIIVAPHVQDYAIRLVLATHPGGEHMPPGIEPWVSIGASPRGAQALIRGAKVAALIRGRYAVAFKDIQAVAHPTLRHRILRSFEAEADGMSTDAIIDRLLEGVPTELEDE